MTEPTGAGGAAAEPAAWQALGAGGGLHLRSAEVIEVGLTLRTPVSTSRGTHRDRPVVLVRLACEDAAGRPVVGWGECAALADTTYDAEDATSAASDLAGDLVPELVRRSASPAGLPGVAGLPAAATGRPLAWAALEMAVGDAWLRHAGTSLAGLLGAAGASVAPGAVVGRPGSVGELVDAVAALADQGYRRVKCKIGPGWDVLPLEALSGWAGERRATSPGASVPLLQVDANGAYDPADLDRVAALDRFGLACIEQPFAPGAVEASAALARRMATPVCLDEEVGSPAAVRSAVAAGACSAVCVKPARLGGIGAALEVVAWCQERRLPWWIGGMFETGLARAANTALAALGGPTLPGDLAPPASYLAEDVTAAPTVVRDGEGGALVVQVHVGPGVGPAPDEAALGRLARSRTAVVV